MYKISVITVLLILLFSCSNRPKEYSRIYGQAQGTSFQIIYSDSAQVLNESKIDSIFRKIDEELSSYDPKSILSKFNDTIDTLNIKHFEHLSEMVNVSKQLYSVSGGIFDPRVAPYVNYWGFGPKTHEVDQLDSNAIDSIKAFYKALNWDSSGYLIKLDSRVSLDFNAIAQGYTVDVLSSYLQQNGIKNYLVELGGEIKTAGLNQKQEPWKVGIDHPYQDSIRKLITTTTLTNESMATSGSYRKFYIKEGKKYAHAINPLTGYPVSHNLLSVTVIDKNCALADALATTLLIMGCKQGVTWIEKEYDHVKFFIVYEDSKGVLKTISSSNFLYYEIQS